MISDIILIGPVTAGKSTLGKLLAQKLKLPQRSLDDLRWKYYEEIHYDEEFAKQLKEKEGFLALYRYWKPFEAYTVERFLSEHSNCVIDFGAGHSVYEDDKLFKRVQRPRFPVSHQQQEQITAKFLQATTQGNLQSLMALLAKDVTYWSDGGGQVTASLKPLHGAMKVARFLLAIRSKWLSTAVAHIIEINGQPGILTLVDGCIHSVTTFDIVDGYIQSVYTLRNPEKLKRMSQMANPLT